MQYNLSDILIDTDIHKIRKAGADIKLTQLEWSLFLFLIENKGRVCTRDEIIEHVWGTRFQYDTGTIDVHLNAIRRKLGFKRDYPIEVVRGVGMIFHSDALSDSSEHQIQMRQNLEWAKLFTSLLPNNLKTCNLRDLIIDVAALHSEEMECLELRSGMKLDPYVSEIITDEDTMRAILNSILSVLLRHASHGGYLLFSSKLNITDFIIKVQVDGDCPDFNVPEMLAAQRFAALLWMPMQMTNASGKMNVEMRIPLKRS